RQVDGGVVVELPGLFEVGGAVADDLQAPRLRRQPCLDEGVAFKGERLGVAAADIAERFRLGQERARVGWRGPRRESRRGGGSEGIVPHRRDTSSGFAQLARRHMFYNEAPRGPGGSPT